MPIKINLKDLDTVVSAEGTDKALITYGVNGDPKLIQLSAVSGSGGVINGGSGILLTCEENGYTYQVSAVLVDGEVNFGITRVSGEGQFTSLLCAANSIVYRLAITIVNGEPTLTPVAI
jgi:hypothetical protein